MAGGFFALLDDVAVFARAAAASVDDVAAAAGQAGGKAAGVVVDDAAVTPSYVTGLSPKRELPIIWKITKGSLRNKLLILLPIALLLSQFLPWAITPLLMLGGCYLSYEGAEKVMEWIKGGGKAAEENGNQDAAAAAKDPAAFEKKRVSSAIRTDLILSAEIMAIALAEVADETIWVRAGVLAIVGVFITFGVYGAVALIVKMDDVGLHLAQRNSLSARKLGCRLVNAMPVVLDVLSIVGTIAMLWVGGNILLHGVDTLGWPAPYEWAHDLQLRVKDATGWLGGILGWVTYAAISAVVGLAVGWVIAFIMHRVFKIGGH